MNQPEWLPKDIIVFECDMAQEAIQLRYFPKTAAFLVVFLTSAMTLDAIKAAGYGIVAWFALTLLLRPQVVNALRGTHIATGVSFFGILVKWLIAIICVVYIWFATQNGLWNGWPILGIAFVLDLLTFGAS